MRSDSGSAQGGEMITPSVSVDKTTKIVASVYAEERGEHLTKIHLHWDNLTPSWNRYGALEACGTFAVISLQQAETAKACFRLAEARVIKELRPRMARVEVK